MRKLLKPAALASAIAVACVGAAVAADQAPESYIVEFAEPGLLAHLRATAGDAPPPRRGAGVGAGLRSAPSMAYRALLADAQDARLGAIGARLGRSVTPTHRYQISRSGIALDLTAGEAAAIANVPGVAKVYPAGVEYQQTYRGPAFIGAESLWSGASAPPPGVGTRGENIIIGGIDGGVNLDHPAFANDPSCGFGPGNDKRLSSVDCSSTDINGVCNGPNAEDVSTGHGVHTISTAAGNTLTAASVPAPVIPPPHSSISGVAPCAKVRTYKACETSSCSGAALTAAIDNAIDDGVDIITYSISGGTNPWSDLDRPFLDAVGEGIFVVAAAGNTSATITNPVGQVNHRGPWVVSVANVSHDENFAAPGRVSGSGPGTPPANTQNLGLIKGSTTPVGTAQNDIPIRIAVNLRACTAAGGVPAGFFTGAAALIERGDCSFSEKINNAQAAGAELVLIFNNAAGTVSMDTTGAVAVPAYSMLQASGQALVAYINASLPNPTTIDFNPPAQQGDVLNASSLRGPTPAPLNTLTKPDIAGPGTGIYAPAKDPEQYMTMSGTSMATPHIAGAAALIMALHPSWTPTEVASALMLTSVPGGTRDDAVTPWDADDVGSGRADLTKAALAGFVMDETFANFLAANPSGGGNPRTLNLPNMRNLACTAQCSWTRTVRNTATVATTWNVTVEQAPGVTVNVSPTTFSFAPGELLMRTGFEDGEAPAGALTQQLTITATPTQALSSIRFVKVVFTEAGTLAPAAHMWVAVQGSP